jgi:hypothetical protein
MADATVDSRAGAHDDRLWSVTTILKSFGDHEGLIHWTADTTATVAVQRRKTLWAMANDDEAAAIAWLREQRFASVKGQRSATKLGTDCHAAFEHLVVTGRRPEMGMQVAPYVDSFERGLDRLQPEFVAAELTVYHEEFGYAGTADGFARVDGMPVIVDYKTSKTSFDAKGKRKRPWTDVALQLAAYRSCPTAAVWRARKFEQWSRRYYLLNDDERALAVPAPAVEGGLCVHVTPEHCDVYPVECGPEVFEAFLFAMEAFRWSQETSRTVLGEPLALIDVGAG